MAGGHAVYASGRPRRTALQPRFRTRSFATEADARLTLRYGVSPSARGNDPFLQADARSAGRRSTSPTSTSFLVDDDTYSNLLQNDLRHPGPDGPRGRPLRLRLCADAARGCAPLAGRLSLRPFPGRSLRSCWGSDAVSRRGYYEKELFPGGAVLRPLRASCGSRPIRSRSRAGWAFTPRRYIEVAAAAAARTPSGRGPFLSAAL